MCQIWKYRGEPLSADQQRLLQFVSDKGRTCTLERGDRPKTISVLRSGVKLCYINSTVITSGAIVGYTFRSEDGLKNINGCPPELLQKALTKVKQRYKTESGWKLHPDSGPERKGNLWYRYLLVMDFDLSKKIIEM